MTFTLPDHVRAAMMTQLTSAPGQRHTIRSVCETTDHRTVWTPALQLIADALADTLATPDGRLIISMPPQEGKSTTASINFPIWALMRNPELRIVTASYGQGLANRNGRAVRNHIKAHPELGLTIAHDNGAVAEWTLDGHRGGLLAVGRGAGVTGRPADLMLIDDPIKDRQEADSKLIRQLCLDWWRDALAARLAPGAPCVLIATRWHQDDLSGLLERTGDWRVLNIPAQCENAANDPLGREPGEFMTSARGRTVAQWEQRKTTAGPRTWAALYQGHPSPMEGGLFRRDWWRHWDVQPWTDVGDQRWLPGGTLVQSWDLAFKGADASDFVVGQVWWHDGARAWLLDQVRGRWGFSATCDQIVALSRRWPQAVAKYVEDKANGPAVIDALRLTVPGLVPVEPQGGKAVRAAAVEPLLAAGNVLLPPLSWSPWVSELIEEAAAFPNGAHDDQVDALTQALTRLYLTRQTRGTMTNIDLG